MDETHICKICSSISENCFEALILNKYTVKYYKCTNCGFIQTEEPYWLEEAYGNAITRQDVGIINRNLYITSILSSVIIKFYNKSKKFIDYGGGYGILTRMMRDIGFDYYLFDIYCENIFAKGLDKTSPPDTPEYELLSAFEVFEHIVNPIEEMEKMLKWSKNIFLSTEIRTHNVNSAEDWWYVMPETGQHIALHTKKSLKIMAEKFQLNFYSNNKDLHLFTAKKINGFILKLILNQKFNKLLKFFLTKNVSLMMTDYNASK